MPVLCTPAPALAIVLFGYVAVAPALAMLGSAFAAYATLAALRRRGERLRGVPRQTSSKR